MRFPRTIALALTSLTFLVSATLAQADTGSKAGGKVSQRTVMVDGAKVVIETVDYGTYQTSHVLTGDKGALSPVALDQLNTGEFTNAKQDATPLVDPSAAPNSLTVSVRRTGEQWSPDRKVKGFSSLTVDKITSTASIAFKVTKDYSSTSWYGGGNADVINLTNQVCFEGNALTVSFPLGMTASNNCGTLGPFAFGMTAFATQSAAGHSASGSNFYPSLTAVKQSDSSTAIKGTSASTAVSAARISVYDQ